MKTKSYPLFAIFKFLLQLHSSSLFFNYNMITKTSKNINLGTSRFRKITKETRNEKKKVTIFNSNTHYLTYSNFSYYFSTLFFNYNMITKTLKNINLENFKSIVHQSV